MTPATRKLAAILSADAVGYSRLMAEDEAETVRTLAACRHLISDLVGQRGGRVVDAPGDNVLAEFPSVVDAVACAVEIQRELARRTAELPVERRMLFRIGVNLGDVVVEQDRIYGDGVNVAARLEGLAEPGGVCISGSVHEEVERRFDLEYEDLGDQVVKNFPKPIRAYRVLRHGSSRQPDHRLRRARRLGIIAGAAAAAGLGLVLAWLIIHDRGDEAIPAADPLLALPAGPTVAVLPFVNLSGDPEQEYFSDGLSDDLITQLSRFRDLFVIARNSTFRYKGRPVDVREVHRELGARYVLEGSVRRAGTSLRVAAQLLDAKDGTHLWAETYDRDLSVSSIFAVQDEITERVVGAIASEHGVISRARFEDVKGRATDNLAAYECVLLAQAYYRDNYVPSEHEGVRSCLERAVQDDPGYADAWAYLTWLYLDEHRFGYHPRPDPLGRALRAAQRAVESDPANQNAHNALAHAHFFRRELDRFFAEADRAVALNPNNAGVLAGIGERLILVEDDERGIALVRRAVALDPYHPTWFNFPIANYHFKRGEYEEALAAARKINIPGYYWPKIFLAAIYGQLGRRNEARAAVRELLLLYPGFTIQTLSKELEKWNTSSEQIEHWMEALRKAGVPDEPGE